MYTLELTTEPPFCPVSLTEAKAFLRVWHDLDDTLITAFLLAATNRAQQRTGRQLVNAQFKLTAPCFPWNRILSIPISSLVKVSSVSYLDSDTTRQALSPSEYRVVTGEQGSIFRTTDSWPTTPNQPGNIEVTYTSGYQPDFSVYSSTYSGLPVMGDGNYGCLTEDDGANLAGVYKRVSSAWVYVRPIIPVELKVGILQSTWHMYDNRGEVSEGSPSLIPLSAESIYESFNVGDEFDSFGVLVDQYSTGQFSAGSVSTVATDNYDTVSELAIGQESPQGRPNYGVNVDGEAVDDGYRVKVASNGLTYLLTGDKTAYVVEDWEITLDTIATRNALYEIQAEQRVYVRENSTTYERNTANTAWQVV